MARGCSSQGTAIAAGDVGNPEAILGTGERMEASKTGGMTTGMDLLVADMQNSPPLAQSPANPTTQGLGFTYNADQIAAGQPVFASSSPYQSGGVAAEGAVAAYELPTNSRSAHRRKKGRPRKYGPDGTVSCPLAHAAARRQPFVRASWPRIFSMPEPPSATAPPPPSVAAAVPGILPSAAPTVSLIPSVSVPPLPSVAATVSVAMHPPPGMPSSTKQARSWTPSTMHQGSTSNGLIHTFIVNEGEDLSAKIVSLCESGVGTVCVLSGHGYLSKVTLHESEPSIFGGRTTSEGWFQILSLSGTFLVSEVDGKRRTTGGLDVILGGTDGQLLFGCVAGALIAASPLQVTVGTSRADAESSAVSELK